MNYDQAPIREFLHDCIQKYRINNKLDASKKASVDRLGKAISNDNLQEIIEAFRAIGILDAKADSLLQVLLCYQCDDRDLQIALLERAITFNPENYEAKFILSLKKENPPTKEQIKLLRSYLPAMKKNITQEVYDEAMGVFNKDPFLNPYLRMNYCLFENLNLIKQFDEAVAVGEYLLELDEADELDLTPRLPALYLATGQYDNAKLAVQSLRAESEALFLWAAFFEKLHTQQVKNLDDALLDATKSNKFVFRYLMNDTFEMPEDSEGPLKPGSAEEACYILDTLTPAIITSPSYYKTMLRIIRDHAQFFSRFVQDKIIAEHFRKLSTFANVDLADISTHMRQADAEAPESGDKLASLDSDHANESDNIIPLHPQRPIKSGADNTNEIRDRATQDATEEKDLLETTNAYMKKAADIQLKLMLAIHFIGTYSDITHYTSISDIFPTPEEAPEELIQYFEDKNAEESMTALQRDGIIDDNMASLIYTEMAYRTNDQQRAYLLFEKAVALDPNSLEPQFRLLQLQNKLSETEEIDFLQSIHNEYKYEIAPNLLDLMWVELNYLKRQSHVRLAFKLILMYLKTEQFDVALELAERSAPLDIESQQDLDCYLPMLYLCCDKKKEARFTLKELKASDEHEGAFLWLDFFAKLLANNKHGASNALRKAIKYKPEILGFIIGANDPNLLHEYPDSESPSIQETIQILDLLAPLINSKAKILDKILPPILNKNLDFIAKHCDN